MESETKSRLADWGLIAGLVLVICGIDSLEKYTEKHTFYETHAIQDRYSVGKTNLNDFVSLDKTNRYFQAKDLTAENYSRKR